MNEYNNVTKKELIEQITDLKIKIENQKHLTTAVQAKDQEIVVLKEQHKKEIEVLKEQHDFTLSKEINNVKAQITQVTQSVKKERERYVQFRATSKILLDSYRATLKVIEGTTDNSVSLFERLERELILIDQQKIK